MFTQLEANVRKSNNHLFYQDAKTVADPGSLVPGVLDWWTPTVNV